MLSFLLGLLLFSFFCSGAAAEENGALKIKFAPVNPAYLEFMEAREKGTQSVLSAVDSARFTGYVPSKIDWSHLQGVSYSLPDASGAKEGRAIQSDALPVSFDLRADYLTVIKSQNPFGNCWTHGIMAAIESNLIKKSLADQTLNLAEWYLTYFAYNDETEELPGFELNSPDVPYYDQGGEDWQATALLTRGTGPVLDSDAPLPKAIGGVYRPERVAQRYKVENVLYLGYAGNLAPSLDEGRAELIKKAMMQYGALSIGISAETTLSDDYENPKTNGFYFGAEFVSQDHAITIVGWDDNFPRGDFGGADGRKPFPNEDGAWIVRNSWSEAWADHGYAYVSYEDGSLSGGIAYDAVPAVQNEHIYQYDLLGLGAFAGIDGTKGEGEGPKTTSYFANIFKAERNEQIHSIALYTPMPDTLFEVTLYVGTDDNNPTSGKEAVTFSGKLAAPGYNTIDLPESIKVTNGENFSVVVKVTMDYEYPIPFGVAALDQQTRSWVSSDDTTWKNAETVVTELDDDEKAVVCLKAFGTATSSGGSSSNCSAMPVAAIPFALLIPIVLHFRKKREKE